MAFSLATGITTALAAPRGRLAYLQDGYAVISDAATGQTKRLPGSKGTSAFAISPRGQSAYFVKQPGFENDGPIPQTGFLSLPPYKTARKLPAALQDETFGQLTWSPTGNTLWLRGFEIYGAYTPATNNFRKLSQLPESVSRNGKIIAYLGDDEIRVRDVNSGRERVIFSRKKPQVLFSALRNGKNPKKITDIIEGLDPAMWKEAINWAISAPALSPDGSRLYFCSNAGSGQGAAGNSSWAIFAADLKSGKIAVLSKVGAQFGRMPETFEVSPDGKRLLALVSVHSSAIDNPSCALVVDLPTQNSRELLGKVAPKSADSNLTWGACWSPDSRYVALAAYFYKTSDVLKQANWNGPKDNQWTLYVQDAATGKVVRRIAGARSPSWAN
jgi:Tol biopolymer transport system component